MLHPFRTTAEIIETLRAATAGEAVKRGEIERAVERSRSSAWKPDAKLPLLINARSETVASKPAFRSAYKRRRCIIPASGYYEWRAEAGGKQPIYFERADGEPIAFAGIWECGNEAEPETCAILTTSANAAVAPIHDRMPVILRRMEWPRWFEPTPLSDEEAARMLVPAPDSLLRFWQVSREVNAARTDHEGLIAPL